MKIKNPIVKSIIVLTILSIIATLYLYGRLPNEVPIHFDYTGVADNYGPRSFVLLTAILPLIMLAFLKVVPKMDPKGDAYLKHGKAYNIFIIFLMLLFIVFHWVSIGIALGIELSINKIVPFGVGMLFIVIGNYMPQIKQNYTFGIKLPWTYNDENNWRATHRVGGYCFIISGILFMLIGFVPVSVASFLTFLSFGCLILPMVYSYLYFRKNMAKKH